MEIALYTNQPMKAMPTERWTDEMLDKLASFGQQTDNRIDRLVELFSGMRSN
jgi:hypothetical protein